MKSRKTRFVGGGFYHTRVGESPDADFHLHALLSLLLDKTNPLAHREDLPEQARSGSRPEDTA